MATTNASAFFYNHVMQRCANNGLNLELGNFEMLLTTALHVPDQENTVIGDINNEVVGNGYARQTLTGVSLTRLNNVLTWNFDDPQFSAVGGDFTLRNWHIFETVSGLLVAFGQIDDTPADVTVTDGNNLDCNIAAAGLLTFTNPLV